MINTKLFACSEDCAGQGVGPDLGPSTKPCDCHNAEIARLMSSIFKMTIELDNLKDIRAMELVAINTLRANNRAWQERILELEANEQAWMAKESTITAENLRLSARVKGLEEAMPDPDTVRRMAVTANEVSLYAGQNRLSAPLVAIADRIEKVMVKDNARE